MTNRRLYDTVRWRKLVKIHLSSSPLCVHCAKSGKDAPATIVHHNPPHENDSEKFWDETTFESVCATCHSGIKRVEESRGYSQAAYADGSPVDTNHPWNKKGSS